MRVKSVEAVLCAALILAGGCAPGETGERPAPTFSLDLFREPPVESRPWVRWWWPGGDVDDAELRREVGLLADRFFGGAEVQPFASALDPAAPPEEMARRLSFDTPEFHAHLQAVLDAARQRGLQIEVTLGSGWPTGGTQVTPETALQTLAWSERQVKGPGPALLTFTGPDKPVFYELANLLGGLQEITRWMPEHAKPVAVVAARVTGGERTTDLLDLTDRVMLDPTSVQLITDALREDGSLVWTPPDSATWQVIAFYRMPDGMYPMFVAQTEPGFVMDHFDAAAVEANLEHLLGERTGLAEYYGDPLQGFFVDSFELKVERFFATDFLEEFLERRGYDVTPFLPATLVPGADNNLFDGLAPRTAAAFGFSDDDVRIQYDYQRTASDLFIERFVEKAQAWAAARGMGVRMQAYGLNVDVIRAAGSVAIPEAEQLYGGGPEVFLKLMSSAAHLYGRATASAESLVWNYLDHMVTPTMVKAGLDKLFAAGITRAVYHGFPYRKMEGYGESGWHPFSSPYGGSSTYSTLVAETDPFWDSMEVMNRYAARCQYLLAQGEPDNDIIVLYPWLGFPASFFRLDPYWEPLFNGRLEEGDSIPGMDSQFALMTQFFGPPDMGARGDWIVAMNEVLKGVHALGWSWDWVNEHSLLEAVYRDGRISIRGASYKALVLADVPFMSRDVAEHLVALAAQGASIVIAGKKPARQPGWADAAAGDAGVRESVEQILAGKNAKYATTLSAEALDALLSAAGAGPGVRYSAFTRIRHVGRVTAGNRRVIFFWNPFGEPTSAAVRVTGGCESPLWLDPMTGDSLVAIEDPDGSFALALPAFGSSVLSCGTPGDRFTRTRPDSAAKSVVPVTDWAIEVTSDDVPGGTYRATGIVLSDWRDIPELRFAGGPGTYASSVDIVPAAGRVVLRLGRVGGVAAVTWNGTPVGMAIVPPFEVDVTAHTTSGTNDLLVSVTPPRKNRYVGKARAGDDDYAQFRYKEDALAPAGLIGPVEVLLFDE